MNLKKEQLPSRSLYIEIKRSGGKSLLYQKSGERGTLSRDLFSFFFFFCLLDSKSSANAGGQQRKRSVSERGGGGFIILGRRAVRSRGVTPLSSKPINRCQPAPAITLSTHPRNASLPTSFSPSFSETWRTVVATLNNIRRSEEER